MTPESQIRRFYATLYCAWGRQHWWPARTRFEVIVGAILTQNTAWTNVARALRSLRQAGALSLAGVRRTPEAELADLIRSSGYFSQKARRLKNFVEFLDARYGGSLPRMFARPTAALREELLALNGVGPETADSILLYAGNHPVFVVDAYTRRIVERHGLLPATAKYEEIRALFERALKRSSVAGRQSSAEPTGTTWPPGALSRLTEIHGGSHNSPVADTSARQGGTGVSPGRKPWVMAEKNDTEPASAGETRSGALERDATAGPAGSCHSPSPMSTSARAPLAQVYNEMHALIVGVGKNYCLKQKPRCDECPLGRFLPPLLRPSNG